MHVHVCQQSSLKTEPAMLTLLDKVRCQNKPCDATHTLYMGCRAVYELTAVVAHVVDAAENSPAGTAPEGHLVAHVKVWPTHTHSSLAHVYPMPSLYRPASCINLWRSSSAADKDCLH